MGQRDPLNELAQRVAQGKTIEVETRIAVDGFELTFHEYRDDTFERLPCGYLFRFEQFFADRFHDSGGSLPIIWAELDVAATTS